MRNKANTRIFYCGMVNTPKYARMIGSHLHIGAGSNKMRAVARAIRDAGGLCYLISMPVIDKGPGFYTNSVVFRECKNIIVFLPTVINRFFRKIISFFCFGWFCFLMVSRIDKVVIYNYAFEYILGAMVLAVKGNKPFLDIEDAPRIDDPGWRGSCNRLLFKFFRLLIRERKFVVSVSISKLLCLDKYCVVYGATTNHSDSDEFSMLSNSSLVKGSVLKIHYGGSLCSDTGVELFSAAVKSLIVTLPRDCCYVEFVVTGFGAADKIIELVKMSEGSGVKVVFLPDLAPDEYRKQFCRCHAALSLKMPNSEMGKTTFPSKVVEITAQGLLLISTKTSDVPLIFDDSNAVLLQDASPKALVDCIAAIIDRPASIRGIAKRGQEKAKELFDSKRVGRRIIDFIADYRA